MKLPNHRSVRPTSALLNTFCDKTSPAPGAAEPEVWPTESMLASLGFISLATRARLRGLRHAGREV